MKEITGHVTEEGNLSRRDLLKALAAGSGALAAAAFLPAKWTRPLVKAGVLPAHAQSTICATVEWLGDEFCQGGCFGLELRGSFSYEPDTLVPIDFELVVCNTTEQPSAWEFVAPGLIYGYYDSFERPCDPAVASAVITFQGGCIGVYSDVENALKLSQPGAGFMGALGN